MNRKPDDADRLSRWVREHGQPLFGFLLRSVGNWALAEDLTQEVFARAWRHREAYQEIGQERAYLLRIAARLVRDHYRRPALATLVQDPEGAEPLTAESAPSAMLEQAETEKELNEALDRLSPAQRQTLLLRYYGEMSFEEIAQVMQIPLSTALSHARRGLSGLRKMLRNAH
jgi:RNA polymerase sigma-70 factor (ECF subfamily)